MRYVGDHLPHSGSSSFFDIRRSEGLHRLEPEDEFGEAVVERGDVGRVTLADARDAAGSVYTRLFPGPRIPLIHSGRPLHFLT